MKKVLLIAVLAVGMMNVASAQESYKPTAGDFSLEVGFAPFGQDIINGGNLAGFIHFSDNLALRLGLSFNFASEKDDNGQTGTNMQIRKESQFRFGIEPGIVYYFTGTPRLAPYIGGGINVGLVSTKWKNEDDKKTSETTHPGGPYNKVDHFAFGVGATTGFNYYFAKNLYVGAEVGLNFGFTSFPNEKRPNTDESKMKVSEMGVGINASSLLRLGWTF